MALVDLFSSRVLIDLTEMISTVVMRSWNRFILFCWVTYSSNSIVLNLTRCLCVCVCVSINKSYLTFLCGYNNSIGMSTNASWYYCNWSMHVSFKKHRNISFFYIVIFNNIKNVIRIFWRNSRLTLWWCTSDFSNHLDLLKPVPSKLTARSHSDLPQSTFCLFFSLDVHHYMEELICCFFQFHCNFK